MINRNYIQFNSESSYRNLNPYRRNDSYNKYNVNDLKQYSFINKRNKSPIQISSEILMDSNKVERFQNENLTVDKISPYHYKYRSIFNYKKFNNDEKKNNRGERIDQYYLKDPCDYLKGEEANDGFKHYNVENDDYQESRYGDYIYNYYLNAPMRSDKSIDWKFPPLYYYNPNKNSNRSISSKNYIK